MQTKKVDSYYDEMNRIHNETSPLSKDKTQPEIPLECIDPDSENYIEEKSQIELEVEIEKKGVPIFDVERPPIPKIETDKTRYQKVTVKRKEKKSDKLPLVDDSIDLSADREMKAYVQSFKIPRKISLFKRFRKKVYDLSCKMTRFCFNIMRKIKSRKRKVVSISHELPPDVKTKPLATVKEADLEKMGRKRGFQREQDGSPNVIQAVRNKKTGVVVMTPRVNDYKSEIEGSKKHNIEDYEVVESQIKDDSDKWSAQDWIDEADSRKELKEELRKLHENS